jgi:hypothetical protein
LVDGLVKRAETEEPDEGNLHVRICGEGAGQPVPLPGTLTGLASDDLQSPLIIELKRLFRDSLFPSARQVKRTFGF